MKPNAALTVKLFVVKRPNFSRTVTQLHARFPDAEQSPDTKATLPRMIK